MKNINKITLLLSLLFVTYSCNEYLDVLPDNRTTVDSKEKIRKILVSAYITNNYALIPELSSDNVADYGQNNPNSTRFLGEVAYWQDITATDNDDTQSLWGGAYLAIANANEALEAINELGTEGLEAEKGEALIARAYAHFVLVNIFAKHYNKQTSGTDLGIVYMEKAEKTLNPKYKRESVKAIYEKINRDIEEALPLINDEIYEVPLYHFTHTAAYAFAARFNLYYEKWDKAEQYATEVLGSTPIVRDWSEMGSLPRKGDVYANAYIDDPADLLAETSSSSMGLVFGAYYFGSRFNHTRKIADDQTIFAPTPWSPSGVSSGMMNFAPLVYTANNLDKVLSYKIPFLFEYTDPVAQTGYRKTVTIPLTVDETLLVRAEARILQGKKEEALADLNLWTSKFYKTPAATVTEETINNFYNAMPYSTVDIINQKKKLNPGFTVNTGTQENMIHYLLQCRRILTLHEGLRWYDVKRYGIEVQRLRYDNSGNPTTGIALPVDDPRRAIQLPSDVISAGLEANPR